MSNKVNIFWFRRDLRLEDNAGLYNALKDGIPVIPIFIFDTVILNNLEDKKDKRVNFIYASLQQLETKLNALKSSLFILHGTISESFKILTKNYTIGKVFTNHDYEPYALERDKAIKTFLLSRDIEFLSFKDQVIFEKNEVVKNDNTPYVVFTPYSRQWKLKLEECGIPRYNTEKYFSNFYQQAPLKFPSLEEIGFSPSTADFPSPEPDKAVLKHYSQCRNFPGIKGTSRLGVHLRFGTISIRKLLSVAKEISDTYVNELIWRDFYQMILWHFPHVGLGKAFKPAYDNIPWRNKEDEFNKWCLGETGYPIVDAGMRELNETGFMHNRVRMIVASFLCKHLLIDWRWGEAYFADKLLDFDLASNNGGWQWASGSGCDSAPYFRIFNPYLQTKKFDPDYAYIKKWVPEFQELTYPFPMVEHEFARKRCLEVYSAALNEQV